MINFVVDNSVAMRWVLPTKPDEQNLHDYARKVLAEIGAGAEAAVPAIWHVEAVNVIARHERRKDLTPGDVAQFFELVLGIELSISTAAPDLRHDELLALVRRHPKLSAYDGTYLALAKWLDVPLATNDADLATVAEAEGVPVLFGGPGKKTARKARRLK